LRDHLDRRSLAALAGITLFAAALRFPTLDLQSYWFDETLTTVRIVRSGLFETVGHLEETAMPPLYPVVAWFWAQLFGEGEVGLRSLSALAGTVTVPVVYAAAATFFDRRAALVAAGLAAANPVLIWYSQEARPYALLILLVALTLLFLGRALEEPTPRRLGLWAAFAALSICALYFAAFVMAGEAVWLLLAAGREARRRAALAIGAVAATALALLPLAIAQDRPGALDWITEIPLRWRLTDIVDKYVAGWPNPSSDDDVWLLPLPLVAVGLLLLVRRATPRERRTAYSLLALSAVGLGVPLLVALADRDLFYFRQLLAALPPVLLVTAAGFGTRAAGRLGVAAAVVLCAIYLSADLRVWTDRDLQRDDWRGATRTLDSGETPRVVVISPDYAAEALEHYGGHTVPHVPAGGVKVREVVLIAAGYTGFPARTPGAGFVPVSDRDLDTARAIRFRASRPTRLTPAEVARRLRLDPRSVRFEPGP
jgi:4-amino-4-deoxy-L-arabinose transferase-like glycosyltransferase